MSERWTHQTVYAALRGTPGCYGSDPKDNSYAYLYPQRLRQNTAVLYAPDSTKYADYPLHIKPEGPLARPELFEALKRFTSYWRMADRFEAYEVHDWYGVAHVLDLCGTTRERNPTIAAAATFDRDEFIKAYGDAASAQAAAIAGVFATMDQRFDRLEELIATLRKADSNLL